MSVFFIEALVMLLLDMLPPMTANAVPDDRARCVAAGMDDFITKPILYNLLYATRLSGVGAARSNSAPRKTVVRQVCRYRARIACIARNIAQ